MASEALPPCTPGSRHKLAGMNEELVQALRTGDTARALALIAQGRAAGADLNAADAVGWTPAHVAAEYGHAGTITALHAAGANLDAAGPMGWTPAHLAAQADHAATIVALHAAGANLNARDEHGQTPVDLARIHGHEHVVNALFLHNQSRLMTTVVEALGDSADTSARNLASDLKCPVMLEAYTTHGETRPVRLPDGPVNAGTGRPVPGSVLSAFAARHCMRPDVDGDLGRPPPTDPLNRNRFTEADAEAYLASDAFLLGDTARVALVSAVWEACRLTDETPAAIAAAATTAAGAAASAAAGPAGPVATPAIAAGAAVPQYQAVLDASAARSASGPRRDQGGPAM